MDIHFNSDNAVDGNSELAAKVRDRISDRLDRRFGSRLTRIEVHVRDVDGTSNRADGIEAMIEARPASGAPVTVSGNGAEPVQAVNAALGQMVSRLDALFGKADRHRP